VSHCTATGMLSMGNTNPESMKKGTMKKNVVSMACCCVADIVEMKSPIPRVLRRNRHTPRNMRTALPRMGMSNQKTAKRVTATIWAIEIRM